MLDIILSIIVACCYGISASIQKYSLSAMINFSIKNMVKNKIWLFSMLIGFIGIFLYIFTLRFVALNTIQPLLALSMIIPILVGILAFREKPCIYESIGIILIIVGVIWITIG
ncbi:MAG: hypothetical protein V1870_00325 [Candidatus Aenigmatarchaeota archaeon]